MFKKDAFEQIKNAEKEFEELFDVLHGLKKGNVSDFNQLIDFQFILAKRLVSLEVLRLGLKNRRKKLVNKVDQVSKEWFLPRVRNLKKLEDAVLQCSEVGRALGDAYVWLFYRNDRKLLQEHLVQKPIEQPPLGIGGIGEIEFIGRVKAFKNQFVIYHGITNILRIGDLSFIDLQTMRVSGVGELKSKRIDDKNLELQLSIIGNKKNELFEVSESELKSNGKKKPFFDSSKTKHEERYQRQLKRMSKSVAPKKTPSLENQIHEGSFLTNELVSLVRGTDSNITRQEKVSDGLILVCYRKKEVALEKSLFYKLDVNIDKKGFQELFNSTTLSNSEHNTILNGTIQYGKDGKSNMRVGTSPLFWLDIEKSVLRDIYFLNVVVMSFFNPAHLFNSLERKGYEIVLGKEGIRITYMTKDKKRKGYLENFGYFLALIKEHLQRETDIIEMVVRCITEIEKANLPTNARVNIEIVQEGWSKKPPQN